MSMSRWALAAEGKLYMGELGELGRRRLSDTSPSLSKSPSSLALCHSHTWAALDETHERLYG